MAVLGTPSLQGSPLQRIGIFPVTDATDGETVDLATWFTSIGAAQYFPATGAGTLGDDCVVAGTSVTIPTGPADDAGYIVAFGASQQQVP